MSSKPLDTIKEPDKGLYELVEKSRAMSFQPGVLSKKTKLFIARLRARCPLTPEKSQYRRVSYGKTSKTEKKGRMR